MDKLPPRFIQEPCERCHGSGQVERINPKWLRAMRESSGRSVRAMARQLGLSAAYLSDVERGHRSGNIAIYKAYGAL